jgi:hypothetical protein
MARVSFPLHTRHGEPWHRPNSQPVLLKTGFVCVSGLAPLDSFSPHHVIVFMPSLCVLYRNISSFFRLYISAELFRVGVTQNQRGAVGEHTHTHTHSHRLFPQRAVLINLL